MIEHIGIEARLVWALLTGEGKNCLEEGGSPYAYEALELAVHTFNNTKSMDKEALISSLSIDFVLLNV